MVVVRARCGIYAEVGDTLGSLPKVAQLLLLGRQLAATCHLAASFTPFPLLNASAEARCSVGTLRCVQIESAQGNLKCVRLY